MATLVAETRKIACGVSSVVDVKLRGGWSREKHRGGECGGRTDAPVGINTQRSERCAHSWLRADTVMARAVRNWLHASGDATPLPSSILFPSPSDPHRLAPFPVSIKHYLLTSVGNPRFSLARVAI